jgi:hypothetical protein
MGEGWLSQEGWIFHTIEFSTRSPAPMSNMDIKHMTRLESSTYFAKLATLNLPEMNKHAAWANDITACALTLLFPTTTHVLRMCAVLTEKDHTEQEGTLYNSISQKAKSLLRPDEDADSNWYLDALKMYAV